MLLSRARGYVICCTLSECVTRYGRLSGIKAALVNSQYLSIISRMYTLAEIPYSILMTAGYYRIFII